MSTRTGGTSPLLSAERLDKQFGRVVTAKQISFELPAGGALGVVGPNGAGKSSLLNLLNGTVRPDAGRIGYAGQDVTRTSAARRSALGIARTFQIPRPFAEMTVFENALVGARFGGAARGGSAHQGAWQALRTTGLHEHANRQAGQLRLLDRKRLELARALATRPRVLLLDEIAGGLTEQELPALVEVVATLRADGVAVIWIEHIVHALVKVIDELMCLAGGEVIAHGDPDQVLTDPRVIEVYLGSAVDLAEPA